MTRRADVIIIGGGVIGCAIAWALADRGIERVVVVEREPDVGEGASKANSAIIHTGFDSRPGSIESMMLRRAAAIWPGVIEALGVPYLQAGALMLARTSDDVKRLRGEIQPRATDHGVATELLDASDVRGIAPYVTDDLLMALSIPGESIVDPFWLTRAYAEAAIAGGAEVIRGANVTGIAIDDDLVEVEIAGQKRIRAAQAIDAAGLHADEVAGLAGDRDVVITPRRGQFLVSEETFGVDRIVLPVPGPMGKGMLVTPIVFGGLLLGPTAHDGDDKMDRGFRSEDAEAILESCVKLVPATSAVRPVRSFVGLRPVPSAGDFVLRPSRVSDRLWLACGIRSTGISVSPSVGEQVADDVLAARGWAPRRRSIAPASFDLPEEAGAIACLCRGVSVGELVGACRRPLRPTTLDALKRRGGAMFGDCQGNLCIVNVATVLGDELGVPVTSVEKGPTGSWLFAHQADRGRQADQRRLGADPTDVGDATDVGEHALVIVGLGLAGSAALHAARDHGLDAAGIDRRGGRTVVGLFPDRGGWIVESQSATGYASVRARAVLLTTGGYVEPREQRGIAGGRPAGIITSNLVDAALEAGLLPGARAVVVGSGSLAERTATALLAAGSDVVARLGDPPLEVRGAARLEAIRTSGGWIEADTLVFADRLLPQPFLLRPLGLIDDRPGTPAPVDPDGRLPVAGLWAAGCCVVADPEHSRCAETGRLAAEAIARDLVSIS